MGCTTVYVHTPSTEYNHPYSVHMGFKGVPCGYGMVKTGRNRGGIRLQITVIADHVCMYIQYNMGC